MAGNILAEAVIYYAPEPKQPNIEDHFKPVEEGKITPIVLHKNYGM